MPRNGQLHPSRARSFAPAGGATDVLAHSHRCPSVRTTPQLHIHLASSAAQLTIQQLLRAIPSSPPTRRADAPPHAPPLVPSRTTPVQRFSPIAHHRRCFRAVHARMRKQQTARPDALAYNHYSDGLHLYFFIAHYTHRSRPPLRPLLDVYPQVSDKRSPPVLSVFSARLPPPGFLSCSVSRRLQWHRTCTPPSYLRARDPHPLDTLELVSGSSALERTPLSLNR
ncbi:hypothetical protein WOLCODRAFT_155190 [Wolfiporia cocos MD-104 SS10]|uniref:Uncharacterized protein n=1 Tax=Wolfiporia cocos (strain MD-104) TaxID=742152 RepID=A0A2H3IXS5_WOLCO|nr:hypothetical protein WOLCODRAFT_155190 [Wolfiporia cocos MD-104 SS10]